MLHLRLYLLYSSSQAKNLPALYRQIPALITICIPENDIIIIEEKVYKVLDEYYILCYNNFKSVGSFYSWTVKNKRSEDEFGAGIK